MKLPALLAVGTFFLYCHSRAKVRRPLLLRQTFLGMDQSAGLECRGGRIAGPEHLITASWGPIVVVTLLRTVILFQPALVSLHDKDSSLVHSLHMGILIC